MKKFYLILLFSIAPIAHCFGMNKPDKYFVTLEPAFQRMCALFKCADINLEQSDFFNGYSCGSDAIIHFFISVKTQALSCQLFGQEITEQYSKKTIMNNKIISEVDVPFDLAQQIIEKKWGHLLKQE